MSEWIDAIANLIILAGIIVNYVYTKRLEERLDALKSWIEFFWHIDFEQMGKFVEEMRKENE